MFLFFPHIVVHYLAHLTRPKQKTDVFMKS